mmetsp:Transcript_4536/g.12016  ORF Transcript_4536/g.12016 Transcript_4536/m.12016 type:complete len:451 (-) Transcript_4536:195-1547(-)
MSSALVAAKLKLIELLDDPEAMREPMRELAQILVDAADRDDAEAAADAAQVFFDVCCSGSGTTVASNANDLFQGGTSHVGVLILGYAGSSTTLLNGLCKFYNELFPSWRVVITVANGLATDKGGQRKLDAQLDRTILELAGCRKVLVHACSNNGHGLFALLLHRKGAILRPRIAAVVYDCAASMTGGLGVSEEADSHVITSTILMQVITMDLTLKAADGTTMSIRDKSARMRILMERGSLALARRSGRTGSKVFWVNRLSFDGGDAFEVSKKLEPHVPVLCLTSEDDTIIPPSSVHAWADLLKTVSGGWRSVTTATLKGTHCMLRQADRANFEAHLRALITEAAIESKDEAIKVARPMKGVEGGDVAGGLSVDAELEGLLDAVGLISLLELDPIRTTTLQQVCHAFERSGGRTGFMAQCKAWGVTSLGERQKMATAVAKRIKEQVATDIS